MPARKSFIPLLYPRFSMSNQTVRKRAEDVINSRVRQKHVTRAAPAPVRNRVAAVRAAMLGNDKSNLKNGTAVPWFPDIANIKDLFVNTLRKGIKMRQENVLISFIISECEK